MPSLFLFYLQCLEEALKNCWLSQKIKLQSFRTLALMQRRDIRAGSREKGSARSGAKGKVTGERDPCLGRKSFMWTVLR